VASTVVSRPESGSAPTTTRGRMSRLADAVRPGLRRTALLALGCNAVLELVQILGVDGYPWRFKTPTYPALFVLDSLVVWAVVAVLHAVVGRFAVTSALAWTATGVLAFANHEKVLFRHEPLYPADWRFATDPGFLLRMVDPRSLFVAGVLIVIAVGGALVVARRRRAADDSIASDLPAPARLTVRLVGGLVGLLVLANAAHFNAPGNATRGVYDTLGAGWRAWSQERNYLGNGFVAGVLYNLDIPPVPVPEGYSAARMAQITERYQAAADRINATRDPGGLAGVNVVIVLSESFSDPTTLRGVHVPEDPIPFTRRLMHGPEAIAGSMLAQNVGGGTANMEFEALTGMSASAFPAQLRVPYQMVVPRYTSFPSAVAWAKSTGHKAVALHPFSTEMYRRRDVYRTFGFDDFLYDDTMHAPTRIGHHAYVSDASTFGQIERTLRTERAPVFMNVVTMQNHMPYAGRYDDPVKVTGPEGRVLSEAGQYVRGLEHSDDAMWTLVGDLRRLHEPTVLVLYGDHLPGIYPHSVFAANGSAQMHRTPYLVWANFPTRDRAAADASAPGPVVSPAHFVDLAAERAGAAVTPYYALLTELRRQVPALEGRTVLGPDGTPEPRSRLSPWARRLLRDYRLVQYDLSVGNRYTEKGLLVTP
jgi:sulfatase-like protein